MGLSEILCIFAPKENEMTMNTADYLQLLRQYKESASKQNPQHLHMLGIFVVLVGYEFLVVADEDAFLLLGVAVLAALQVVDGVG